MMLAAPISPVTPDRLCCWFTAGNDGARPDRPSVPSQRHRSRRQDRSPGDGSPSKRVSVLDDGSADGFTSPVLDRRCQRNPHSIC